MQCHRTLLDLLGPICKFNTHPAVIFHNVAGKRTITYHELLRMSQELSSNICSLTNGLNTVIAIAIADLHYLCPAAIVGILKANGTFMYIDTNLGKQELEMLIAAAKCSLVITDHNLNIDGLSGWEKSAYVTLNCGKEKLFLLKNGRRDFQADDIFKNEWRKAYIIKTSGSTGEPKLVHVPHACILPNIIDLRKEFSIDDSDIILGCSPFTFDPSVVDIFLAFSTGATLVLVEPSLKTLPSKLMSIIEEERVTILQATPSLLLLFGTRLSRERLLSDKTSLRVLALGGEPFPSPQVLREHYSPKNTTTIFNLYGITEVSCWATIGLFEKESDEVDLGRPLQATQLRVVNDREEEIEEGHGFLQIGGSRVCLLDDEKPENIILPIFRNTGDMVKKENGKLFYLGRSDNMTKRLGQRLSLLSVEATATKSGMTSQCCAFLDGNRLILACKNLLSADALKEYFRSNSPTIEQPNELFVIEDIPLSKHGKIDRKKLIAIYTNKKSQINHKVNVITLLSDGWKGATGKKIDSEANFIMSGGNSLSAIELANWIQVKTGRSFPNFLDILVNRSGRDVIDYLNDSQIECNPTPHSRIFIYQKHSPFYNTEHVKDALNINLKWKFRLNKCIDASPLVIARSDSAAVYVGSHACIFSSINLESGQELWTRELPDRIESSATCDPKGENIFVGCYDGNLFCFDAQSGETRWRFLTGDSIKSSPLCVGSTVIFGSHDKNLYCLSAADGSLIWSSTISSGSLFASPTWDQGNRILAASLDGTCSALHLLSGECIWSFKLDKPVFSSPVCLRESDRCLFACVGGTLNCRSTVTGAPIWKFQAQGPIFSTPSIFKNRIIFGSHDHALYCLDSENGIEIWHVVYSSPVYSSPFAGPMLICSDTSGLLRIINPYHGKVLSETRLPGETFSSPVIASNSILIGCRDDFLYCFQASNNK